MSTTGRHKLGRNGTDRICQLSSTGLFSVAELSEIFGVTTNIIHYHLRKRRMSNRKKEV